MQPGPSKKSMHTVRAGHSEHDATNCGSTGDKQTPVASLQMQPPFASSPHTPSFEHERHTEPSPSPSPQRDVSQSVFRAQVRPLPQRGQVGPPQSMSVSLPLRLPSLQVGAGFFFLRFLRFFLALVSSCSKGAVGSRRPVDMPRTSMRRLGLISIARSRVSKRCGSIMTPPV